MIRKLTLPLIMLGIVASSMLAPAANAESKQIYVENLKKAFASFSTVDGCYRISGVVVAGDDTAKVNQGEDRAGTHAFAFIDVYDSCAQEWIFMAETGGEDLNVEIAPNLRSASIDDTVIAHNFLADEDVPVHFDLDWKGSGRKLHDRDVVEVEFPGPNGTTIYAISKAGYQSMNAIATGTITIGDHVVPIQVEDAQIMGVKANTHYTPQ